MRKPLLRREASQSLLCTGFTAGGPVTRCMSASPDTCMGGMPGSRSHEACLHRGLEVTLSYLRTNRTQHDLAATIGVAILSH